MAYDLLDNALLYTEFTFIKSPQYNEGQNLVQLFKFWDEAVKKFSHNNMSLLGHELLTCFLFGQSVW